MRRVPILLVTALAGSACATTHDTKLEARVRDLEREVADLRAHAGTNASAPMCETTRSRGFPEDTKLTSDVPFMVSDSDVRPGDAIVIESVRGDRPRFDVNGAYVVRGTYKLESADEAQLAFTEQTMHPGLCSSSSGHDKLFVHRGTGTFELATALPFEGYAHVAFYVHDHGVGGVVFGRTPTFTQNLARKVATITR